MKADITSLRHPLVKELLTLRESKEARTSTGTVLLIGEKMVRELAETAELQLFLSTKPETVKAVKSVLVTPEVMQKITGFPSPDGFAAVAPLPRPSSLEKKQRIVVLDGLADPGNLGTLLRTALALNWDGALFTPGTVDPFNDKALRASKGALFTLPYSHLSCEDAAALLSSYTVYVADLEGTPLSEVKPSKPLALALILGNEGAGPGKWTRPIGQKITIPMKNEVDSLNVAASGAIFLYILKPS